MGLAGVDLCSSAVSWSRLVNSSPVAKYAGHNTWTLKWGLGPKLATEQSLLVIATHERLFGKVAVWWASVHILVSSRWNNYDADDFLYSSAPSDFTGLSYFRLDLLLTNS